MFERVVIAIDGSKEALHAAKTAVKLGLAVDNKVSLVTANDLNKVMAQSLNEEERANVHRTYQSKTLDPAEKELTASQITVVAKRVVEASPAEAIREAAEESNADLVVVGRRGMGKLRRLLVGSVSLKVLELVNLPVLVVPENYKAGEKRRIVAPTDFSGESKVGIQHSHRLAKHLGADLLLVHDVPTGSGLPAGMREVAEARNLDPESIHREILQYNRDRLEELADPIRDDGVEVKCIVNSGSVEGSITTTAADQNASFICMASRGRSGFQKFLLGSFAAKVVKVSQVPVLVVRSRDSDDAA